MNTYLSVRHGWKVLALTAALQIAGCGQAGDTATVTLHLGAGDPNASLAKYSLQKFLGLAQAGLGADASCPLTNQTYCPLTNDVQVGPGPFYGVLSLSSATPIDYGGSLFAYASYPDRPMEVFPIVPASFSYAYFYNAGCPNTAFSLPNNVTFKVSVGPNRTIGLAGTVVGSVSGSAPSTALSAGGCMAKFASQPYSATNILTASTGYDNSNARLMPVYSHSQPTNITDDITISNQVINVDKSGFTTLQSSSGNILAKGPWNIGTAATGITAPDAVMLAQGWVQLYVRVNFPNSVAKNAGNYQTECDVSNNVMHTFGINIADGPNTSPTIPYPYVVQNKSTPIARVARVKYTMTPPTGPCSAIGSPGSPTGSSEFFNQYYIDEAKPLYPGRIYSLAFAAGTSQNIQLGTGPVQCVSCTPNNDGSISSGGCQLLEASTGCYVPGGPYSFP